MLGRVFWMECRRAFLSKRFAGAVLLMLLMETVSSALVFTDPGFGVDEVITGLFSGTGSATVILMLFPLIPFSLSYARDMEDHALEFYMVRMGTGEFVGIRLAVSCMSAFFCVVVSFFLFSLLLLAAGHPLFTGGMAEGTAGYRQLMGTSPGLYLPCYLADRGLGAVMMAACAVCMSVLYSDSLFVFCAPVCLYLLSVRLVFPAEVNRTWLIPNSWIEDIYEAPQGALVSLLCKLGVTVLVCTVYGIVAVAVAERRWRYA